MEQLWQESEEKCYDWWPEFSSLIWRYAVSWCSGYFIFQLFTPLAFHFHGAEFAGKIGISIAMWTAGFNVASSWLTAVTPRLNILIAEQKWLELDQLFNRSLARCMGTMLIGGSFFFIIEFILQDKVDFFKRLLPPISMAILFFCWIGQAYVNGLAVYLRAHKKEPLMQLSFYSAIYVAVGTVLSAQYLQSEFLFIGFFTSYIWGIPMVVRIFYKQKKEHNLEMG